MVEYMEEQLQGEGTRGEAARVQEWHLQFNIEQYSTDDIGPFNRANDYINCGQTAGSCG